ncbi:hypothetical protein AC630_26030 [Bradyrhizobium sp. AS23.2]|nr:hypothetical protein AC630_26030 [Bradyrhizobium sp. AS23.2]
MRRAVILALSVMSVEASTPLAIAGATTCKAKFSTCYQASSFAAESAQHCIADLAKCQDDGTSGVVIGPGTLRPAPNAGVPPLPK